MRDTYKVWGFLSGSQTRYQVKDYTDGSALLRIEPVKAGRDDASYECIAENGVGDAVSAEASLTVFEGKCTLFYGAFRSLFFPHFIRVVEDIFFMSSIYI